MFLSSVFRTFRNVLVIMAGGKAAASLLTSWKSWVSQSTMIALARAGKAADPSVYKSLDSAMTSVPDNVIEAYAQAAYFLALAARRADYEGDKGVQIQFALS